MLAKGFIVAAAALAILPSSNDAFVPSTSLRASRFVDIPTCHSPTSLEMGKSQTTPGPAGKASSGPSVSEYRQKKMSNRLKGKKKKKGGFGGSDGEEDVTASSTSGGPIMEIELVAEPEGGEEVAPLAAADNSESDFVIRLKDMGAVDSSDPAYELKDSLGAEVHNFWLFALAGGDAIKKTRTIVLKDAAKKSDFPGFRKGQIPPYAQPKMTNFALREVIITSCQAAIKEFGVNEINEGDLGAVTFNEDVDAISAKYNIKTCPSVPFTANFRAYFDPEAVRETPAAEEEAGPVQESEESIPASD